MQIELSCLDIYFPVSRDPKALLPVLHGEEVTSNGKTVSRRTATRQRWAAILAAVAKHLNPPVVTPAVKRLVTTVQVFSDGSVTVTPAV